MCATFLGGAFLRLNFNFLHIILRMLDFSSKKLKVFYKILSIFLCVIIVSFVAFILFINFYKKHFYPIKYQKEIEYYCKDYSIDITLVYSIINVESSFNPNAVSPKGAIGLMQVLPSTAQFISTKLDEKDYDLKEPKTNIRFGCYYIKYLLNKYGERDTAVCAYNAGEGKVNEWLKNQNYSKDGKTLYNVPYKETREYLKKINKNYKRYAFLYKKIVDN